MRIIDIILRRLGKNKITILAFHKIPEQMEAISNAEPSAVEFVKIINFIKSRFDVISLHEALDRFHQNAMNDGGVCLTFDDGYVEWLNVVTPLLVKQNIPATFFVTTGQLDGIPLWHERIRHALLNATDCCPDICDMKLNKKINITSIESRRDISRKFEQFLKTKPLNEREKLISFLESELGFDCQTLPRLTENNIREMARHGFDIGAHSVRHPILSACSQKEAENEIYLSKMKLEAVLGREVKFFAYPNGRRADFNDLHVSMVRDAGYKYAFTTEPGYWTRAHDPLRIPRFTPWGPSNLRMAIQMSRNFLK